VRPFERIVLAIIVLVLIVLALYVYLPAAVNQLLRRS
jgi:hypothetical protein